MPKAALVRIIRGNVENIIVADGEFDYPPKGYALIPIGDDDPIEQEHQWDETEAFNPPRKYVGVDDTDHVIAIVTRKYYEAAPAFRPEVVRVVEVTPRTAVEVGWTRNPDDTFSRPNGQPAGVSVK